MPDQTKPQAADLLTPEVLSSIAEAVGSALTAKPAQTKAGTTVAKAAAVAPVQAGTALGDALAPAAAPLLAKAENKLKSRKLWTALGTIAVLAAQNPLGLNLSPAAQLGIAAVAAIYVAAQGIVDGQGGGK